VLSKLNNKYVLPRTLPTYVGIIAYKLPTYQLINQMPLREVSGNVLRPQPDVQSRRPGIENQQDTPATRKRPGLKIKAFEARPYKQNKPMRRIERSYPKRRKIDVLLFLTHYRVKDDQKKRSRGSDTNSSSDAIYRPPTYRPSRQSP